MNAVFQNKTAYSGARGREQGFEQKKEYAMMEVLQGDEYTIVRMPENVSAEAIDDVIKEFARTVLAKKEHSEYLLTMDTITQLHRAGLLFITTLYKTVANSGCALSIAGLRDAVENALRHNHVDEIAPLFKTVIDFERQKDIVFDFGNISAPAPEKTSAGPFQSVRGNRYNVLILDPSIASRNNQKLVLGKLPVDNIIEAKEAQEALKRLRLIQFEIDVIVADFESIKLLAEEFTGNVRALPFCSAVKIIATTSEAITSLLIDETHSVGIDAIIIKNYGKDDLSKFIS